MKVIKQNAKSKTNWYLLGLTVLTTAQANLPLLQEYLKDHFGWVMFLNILSVAILRQVTTKPISEK